MRDMARLLVTGATGNTGIHVLQQLREARPDLDMLAFVRSTADLAALSQLGVTWHVCDLNDPSTYRHVLRPGDVLLEMANLRYARSLLPVLAEAGMHRAFCVTTTAVYSTHHSYSALYKEIEEEMKRSPVNVTILRPSMIYGNERDHNMHKLLRLISRLPLYPIFGSGRALMQPVHVADLAAGIVQAVQRDAHGEFDLAGPEALPYRQIVDEAFLALHRRGWLLFVPAAPVATLVRILERVPKFPIKFEQVVRLQEDKSFDITRARNQLNYMPRPFSVGIAQEVEQMRRVGLL